MYAQSGPETLGGALGQREAGSCGQGQIWPLCESAAGTRKHAAATAVEALAGALPWSWSSAR